MRRKKRIIQASVSAKAELARLIADQAHLAKELTLIFKEASTVQREFIARTNACLKQLNKGV
jgi:hypothetical protein